MNKSEILTMSEQIFTKDQVLEITEITFNKLRYINHDLKLVCPKIKIKGKGNTTYYTYHQLVEINLIKHLQKSGLTLKELKRAKNTLIEISGDDNLSNKCVVYAYGELFYILETELGNKVIELLPNTDKSNSLIAYFLMKTLENEIQENYSKLTNKPIYSKELVPV